MKLFLSKILIIDDQQNNIDILVDFLQMQGYVNIKTITDSRLAISGFKEFLPDIVLLDLMMPHLDGYQVMQLLKQEIEASDYVPVLILTADISISTKQKALRSGAKDFLTKPFDFVEIDLRIKNLLETRFLHTQLEARNQILEEKVKERTAELEQINQDLVIAKEKAEESDRLKTAFLQNISHEVRTPLNGIVGFGSILVEPDLPPDERQQFSELLLDASDRLLKTITDYIDMSLLSTSSMEVVYKEMNTDDLIMDLFHKYQDFCSKKELEFVCIKNENQSKNLIISDYTMLYKIISHLLDNAVKFTHTGKIEFGYNYFENNLLIFVKDSGVGISKEKQEIVFGKFIQENLSNVRDFEGSGLGLSISKNMIELLNGKIWIESEKNQGTKVSFTIPLNLS